ncbi:MAG: hypothetical protein ACRBBP_06345 [Bdellovibrionales bacterium]
MTSQMIRISALLLSLSLTSCVSAVTSRLMDLDYSLIVIQKGIKKAFPVDFKTVSRDGRVFESHPFVRNGTKLVLASVETERGRAIIDVRGVSRPYTIEITVEIEEATNPNSVQKDFRVVGYDDVVAKIFLARLKAYLQKSKKVGNVIDDFRVY